MFQVNQKVWCAIYGAGVVTEVKQPDVTYPIIVNFREDLGTVSYTRDGQFHVSGNVVLFPYPVEIVKATTKPSIDWSHVNERFQWLATDDDGKSYLYVEEPLQDEHRWETGLTFASAANFASFVPGTCNWKHSLVKRPE